MTIMTQPGKGRMGRAATARALAASHAQIEPDVQLIVRVVTNDEVDEGGTEPVKLLEVNPSTVPVGIQPVYFTPDDASGVSYASVVIEVTPDEFAQIRANRIHLPRGWQIGDTLYEKSEAA